MKFPLLLLCLIPWVSSFTLPSKLAAVVNQTQQAEVLTYQSGLLTTTVIIGTPGKAFNVAVDLTTGFLWVPDVNSHTTSRNTYNESGSSTFNNYTRFHYSMPTNWGDLETACAMDTVILGKSFAGDPSRTSITVPNATFGLATKIPPNFPSGVDGVLGFAYYREAPASITSAIHTATAQGDIANGTFVIWMEDQWETSDNGSHGVIYYGGPDYLHCKADQRQMYPLSRIDYWEFTVPSFSLNVPNKTPYKLSKAHTAFMDSLNPYITLPLIQMNKVLDYLGLARGTQLPATVPCDTKIDLAFNFPSGAEHVTELNLVVKQPDGTCQLAVVGSNQDYLLQGYSYYTFGIPFLRGRCTFFDYTNEYIGFSEPLTHGGH